MSAEESKNVADAPVAPEQITILKQKRSLRQITMDRKNARNEARKKVFFSSFLRLPFLML